jgi:hypothetical protein
VGAPRQKAPRKWGFFCLQPEKIQPRWAQLFKIVQPSVRLFYISLFIVLPGAFFRGEIAKTHIIKLLFAKFTILFTIQIRRAEKYQSKFAKLILIDMKNKRNFLYSLAIMLVGVIYVPVQAQQKNGAHRANFSGEWKSKQSISMGGNIVCSYDEGDRMLSKTMKIAEQADFLTIEVPNLSPGAALVKSKEKLAFDGKASEINHGRGRGKKFTVKLSADGQTMTVNSIVYLMIGQKQEFVYVTEVWKLSNDGKSISVQANAKSTLFGGERSWKTIFDKAT